MKIRKSAADWTFDLLNIAFMLLLMAATLYPMLHVIFASVSDANQLQAHRGLLLQPYGFDLSAFRRVFDNPMILSGYQNTLINLTLGTVINVFLTTLGAYALSRPSLMTGKYIMFGIVFTMLFSGGMIPAYLLVKDLGLINNVVHFAPVEDDYQEYLTEMRKWYAEGLIDPDFAATDTTRQAALISENRTGVFWGGASGGIGKYLNSMRPVQPDFNLTAVQYPAGKYGINYNIHPDTINSIPGAGAAITTANKHVEETVKWLDYMYSEEGARLMNFGIEGETYTMVDGEPIYTDAIFKDPEGRSPDVVVASHTCTPGETSLYASGYYTQMLFLPEQKEALKIWGNGDYSLNMPPVTYTTEESQTMASIMNEVNTYVDEMLVRFIMGQDGVEDFETFRNNLKNMRIEEAIWITQAALDRYNARA